MEIARRLSVGLLLIVAASAILLFSDPKWRRQWDPGERPREVALINYITVPVLEAGEEGLLDGLAEAGFRDGDKIEITRYNAEGDRSTAVLISKEVAGGDFDLVLTLSTPVLQSFANANRQTRKRHVFTLTTDPWGAGVGISREDPAIHPPYMTGQGTLQRCKRRLTRHERPISQRPRP